MSGYLRIHNELLGDDLFIPGALLCRHADRRKWRPFRAADSWLTTLWAVKKWRARELLDQFVDLGIVQILEKGDYRKPRLILVNPPSTTPPTTVSTSTATTVSTSTATTVSTTPEPGPTSVIGEAITTPPTTVSTTPPTTVSTTPPTTVSTELPDCSTRLEVPDFTKWLMKRLSSREGDRLPADYLLEALPLRGTSKFDQVMNRLTQPLVQCREAHRRGHRFQDPAVGSPTEFEEQVDWVSAWGQVRDRACRAAQALDDDSAVQWHDAIAESLNQLQPFLSQETEDFDEQTTA